MLILTCISSVFLYRCGYKNCVSLTCHLWVTLGVLEYKIFSYWVIEVAMTCLQESVMKTVLRLGHTELKHLLEILWWPLTCDAMCWLHSQRWLASTCTYLWNSSMSVCCRMDVLNLISFCSLFSASSKRVLFELFEYSFHWNRCWSLN
jgi:hypothetical protein